MVMSRGTTAILVIVILTDGDVLVFRSTVQPFPYRFDCDLQHFRISQAKLLLGAFAVNQAVILGVIRPVLAWRHQAVETVINQPPARRTAVLGLELCVAGMNKINGGISLAQPTPISCVLDLSPLAWRTNAEYGIGPIWAACWMSR